MNNKKILKKMKKFKINTELLNKNSVSLISKIANKKGKIKNKKRRKSIKPICTHNIYSSNGKIKPNLSYVKKEDDNGNIITVCRCNACGAEFNPRIPKPNDVKRVSKESLEQIDIGLFLSDQLRLGKEVSASLKNIKVDEKCKAKILQVIFNEGRKSSSKIKNLKNKNKNKDVNYSNVGTWASSRDR